MIYVHDGLRHIRTTSGIFLCSFTSPTKQHLGEHAMPPPPTPWPSCLLCMSKWLRLAMGHPTVRGNPDYAGTLLLRRVRLNACGYDVNGTYFGSGNPLYWYASSDGTIDGVLRASSRDAARSDVLAMYPKARVRR